MAHVFKLPNGDKVQLPTPHLSYSQIAMYLRCPRQYYFRYIQGLKEPPGLSLAHGLAGHKGLEHNNIAKMAEGEDLPTDAVTGKAQAELDSQVDTAGGIRELSITENRFGKSKKRSAKPADLDRHRKVLNAQLEAYMEETAPLIDPIGTEEIWEKPVRGVPVLAYTDLRTARGTWDYKFGMSRSTRYSRADSADKSLQLSLYSLLTGDENVGYYVFLPPQKLKTVTHPADVRKVMSKRGLAARLEAAYMVESVARAISAGAFPLCPPDNFLCSPGYCGYWHRCRGRFASLMNPEGPEA